MSMATKLQRATKAIFHKKRETAEAVIKMAQLGRLSDVFALTTFSEAAAYEFAVKNLTFTEDFIDGEMGAMSDPEVMDICQERKQMLTEQLLLQIGAKMTSTEAHHLHGITLALNVFDSCLSGK